MAATPEITANSTMFSFMILQPYIMTGFLIVQPSIWCLDAGYAAMAICGADSDLWE